MGLDDRLQFGVQQNFSSNSYVQNIFILA